MKDPDNWWGLLIFVVCTSVWIYVVMLRADIRNLKASQQADAELIAAYRGVIETMHRDVAEGVSEIVHISVPKSSW